MSIKAVIFDYGQVISLPQDTKVIDRLAEIIGVSREKFEPLLWSLRVEYDRGVITAKEYYNNILSSLNIRLDEKIIDEIIRMDLESWKNINPGTEKLMEDVKKAGYILGILSNMPHDFLAWARKNIPVFSLPHLGLFSCEVNLVKPDKAIYLKLLSQLSETVVSAEATVSEIKGEELVFFDDNPENVRSAKALGINAFVWESPENARRELLSLGVKLQQ